MNNKHVKVIFYISVISVLIAIGAFILFFKIIENKNKHISTVSAMLEKKLNDKKQGDVISQKLAEVDTIHESVNSHFVDGKQIDSFVEYLENIGTDFGMKVKVENFEIPDTEKNKMFVRVSFIGKFTNIMHVIKLLENTPYQTHIINASVSKDVVVEEKDTKIIPEIKEWEASIIFSILTL